MNEHNIKKNLSEIYLSLENKKLKDAFDRLEPVLTDLQDWQLKETKKEEEVTYRSMLRYLTEGVKDPEQQRIYEDLLRTLYKIVDSAFDQWNVKNVPGLYSENKKVLSHTVVDKSLISSLLAVEDIAGKIALTNLLDEENERDSRIYELYKEQETSFAQLFQLIWLNSLLPTDEAKAIEGFLENKLNSSVVRCLIVSAITLSVLFSFDEHKALILLRSCENPDQEICQRAIVGLLLFLRKYDKRLWLYPQIRNRLDYLSENSDFRANVRGIILQFILSRETEKITKKITEELIPEMMKISPELSHKIKLDDLIGESGVEDKNPEWEEILEKSGLNDKFQEFSELQMEGADIMHSSFVHLKTYPFFYELSNWFLPFHRDQTAFKDYGSDENKKVMEALKESTVLCNSDKYSFFFSVSQMPESYRKMMTGQLAAESEAMKEIQKETLPDSQKKSLTISKQYIQDLYRFFKIHPNKKEFEDIFEDKTDLMQVNSISGILPDKESRMIVGEYYFKRNYFNEAIFVFDCLIKEGADDDVIFQKKGYCLQMTGDLENALQAYLQAELLNGNSSWTIKKIAHCYRMLKKPEDALTYYRKAELISPDNLSIQINIGHCYLELKDYKEALKCYFKVEYLDKNGERAWRPIAWCAFLTGKYEQAIDYFKKIIEKNPDTSDYLNYGHTLLAVGNINQAISFYKLAIENPNGSVEKFNEMFKSDLPELFRAGVKKDDIPLILDRLMYDFEPI